MKINLKLRIRKITILFCFLFVRLNLFNHVLALFHIKFACILAIRYPIFRWESCKGCE